MVQLVEMFVKKTSPVLYRALGIFLPLITTNCAILGLALFAVLRDYSFIQTIVFGIGAGVGFTLAIVVMAGIREELEMADIPYPLKGAGITLIVAGFPVFEVFNVFKGFNVFNVFKVFKVFEVSKIFNVFNVFKVFKVFKGLRIFKDFKMFLMFLRF